MKGDTRSLDYSLYMSYKFIYVYLGIQGDCRNVGTCWDIGAYWNDGN